MRLLQQLGAFTLPPCIQVIGIKVLLSIFCSAGIHSEQVTCSLARTDPASAHVVGVVGGEAPGDNPLMQGLRESTQAGMEDIQHTKIQKIPSFLI